MAVDMSLSDQNSRMYDGMRQTGKDYPSLFNMENLPLYRAQIVLHAS
jgi:hypothetical protein